ncbi:hypothetical protein Btru_026218 [Bulinus truncatus]|nr:hypothetical protein Btru_026218 [Bulinus truncatus]
MASKGGKDTTIGPDISQLRNPIQISGKPIEQVLKGIHYGSPELRCLLLDECDLIFECKVCRALFRDVPNFISHKRVYCTKSSLEDRHIAIASLPEEKVIVIQPLAPEEVDSSQNRSATQRPAKPSLDETIQRIQSGELGKSQAYKVYTEAAEKLQKQKETMKIATIRTTPIPGNKNAVFIDVNTTSVNIHERQQQQSANSITSLGSDSCRVDTPGNSRNKKSAERTDSHSTRHLRKPARREKTTPEPQKLLLEHLKEIQHKVKQKSASQDNADRATKQKTAAQDNSASVVKSKSKTGNITSYTNENEIIRKNVENNADNNENSQQKDSDNLSSLARQNFLSLLAKEETKSGAEIKDIQGKVSAVITRKKTHKKWTDKSKQSATEAAKEIVKSTARENRMKCSLTCVKCGSIFSSRKSLGFHMKIHHSPKRTFYQCPYCPSSFYYFFGITRHLFNNHSKTSDEIDKMRAQLRDKAIVKPAPPPKQKKDMFEMKSSRRRAAAYQQAQISHDGSSPKPKIKGKPQDTKISNIFQSSGETIVLHDSSDSGDDGRFKIIEPKDSSLSKSTDVKITLRESDSEANKHVDSGNSLGLIESIYSDGMNAVVKTSTTVMPGHTVEVYQNCPKCSRSFSRERLFENHIKICQNDVSLTKKIVDKSTSPAKGTSISTPYRVEEVADSKLLALKNKLLSSTFGLTRVADMKKGKAKDTLDEPYSQAQETHDLKALVLKDKLVNTFGLTRVGEVKIVETRSKAKEVLGDSLESKKISDINSQTSRSASSDRDVSRTSRSSKSDTEKDKRDSSTESTQSNSEGRPARSRRAVPSKYAVVTNLVQKSPQKIDNPGKNDQSSVKTIPENALPLPKLQRKPEINVTSNSNITMANTQIIFPMPKLLKRPDIDEKNIDIEIKSSQILVSVPKLQKKPEIDSPIPVSQISSGSLSSTMETRHKTNKNSYRMMVMGLVKKKEMLSPSKRSSSKVDAKRPLGCPQKTYFSPRIPSGSPTSSPQKHLSSQRVSSSPQRQYVTNSSHRRSLSTVFDTQKASRYNHNKTDNLSIKQTSNNDHSDKLDEVNVKVNKSDSLDCEAGDKNVSVPMPNNEETDKTSHVKESLGSDIKAEDSNSDNAKSSPKNSGNDIRTTPQLPVSALSERPKRKRKVPNRNLDAEEMLSKIHNREPAIPNKKIRLSEGKFVKQTEDKQSKTEDSPKIDGHLKEPSNKGSNSVSDGRKNIAASSASMEDLEDNAEICADEIEKPVKSKGRVVSNRIYVLNESKSKVQKLKCYDQTRVAKYIDVENTSCLQCGEMCTSISNLRRHIIRQHLKWSRFKCKLCRFESYDRSECTTHLFRTHKKIAAHNFSSKRSLNSLIIDLVKQGLEARILKKTKTILGKQLSQTEGNIYARPNVKKGPRLPERAAAAAIQSTRTGQFQVSLTDDEADVSKQSIESNSPNSTSSIIPPETRLKALTTRKSRKIIPVENTSRDLDATDSKTESGIKKVEYWYALLPDGKFERIPAPSRPTRNYARIKIPGPKKQTSSDDLVLQTRKGKYTKLNMLPGTSLSDRKGNQKNSASKADSVTICNSSISDSEKQALDGNYIKSDSPVPEKSTPVSKTPNSNSKAEIDKSSPIFIKGRPVSREVKVVPPPSKPSVKYIITPAGPTKVVDKSPRNQLAVSKIREVTAENSPALSDQLAKSLMKLKKLGDSMTSSTVLPGGFTTKVSPSSSPATLGSASTAMAISNSDLAHASKPIPKVPVTVVGKPETPQGKMPASSSNSLSLASGSAASSFVLTRGASGKIIVYTHPAEDKQTTHPSTSTPLKPSLPTSLSTSKITVKSKDAGSKSAMEAKFDDDSLPSGRYFIHQHFFNVWLALLQLTCLE